MVVAWRIARLMRLGRTCPDLDAELFFDPDEIQADTRATCSGSHFKPTVLEFDADFGSN